MIKYGKTPARSLESFGVAGLLGEDCQVFYSTLFNTQHVGRVSDLLCAKLREAGVEEFQLRIAVLIKLFEVALILQDHFEEPISVECGIDEEKAAIGVSFTLPEGFSFDPESFVSKIGFDRNLGPLERLSAYLREACDRLVFRFEPKSRRFETVVLIPLKEKMEMEDRAPFEAPLMVLLAEGVSLEPPKAANYTELGDVDYGKLLGNDTARVGGDAPEEQTAAGKTIAAMAQAAVGKTKVKGKAEAQEEEATIKRLGAEPASEEEEDEKLVIKGSDSAKTEKENTKTVVKSKSTGKSEDDADAEVEIKRLSSGPAEAEQEDATIVVKSSSSTQKEKEDDKIVVKSKAGAASPELAEKLKAAQDRIKQLEARVRELEAGGKPEKAAAPDKIVVKSSGSQNDPQAKPDKQVFKASPTETEDNEVQVVKSKKLKKKASQEGADSADAEEEVEEESFSLGKMMKKMWPFKKEESEEGAEGEDEGSEQNAVQKVKGSKKSNQNGEEKTVISGGTSEEGDGADDEEKIEFEVLSEASKEADELVKQSESLETTINRAQKESTELKKELEHPKAKKWVDGLMQELLAEKAKINDMAKKLNLSLRQKELEFRNKERTMQQEVRQRDEMIKQRTSALARTKEQLTQVQASLEQTKTAVTTSGDEAYKQKYTTAQKLLSTTKEENQAFKDKIEEMKNQMMVLKAQKVGGSSTELKETKLKFDHAKKQVDEYRKLNQQLLDRVAEMNKKNLANANAGNEEVRKRLEQAAKLAQTHQKEAEALKLKVEEMRSEHNRLLKELEQAKKAKAA